MNSIAKIFERVQTSPAESLVLQTIAYRANVQGMNCRISYEALAAATGFSIRYVISLVQQLEDKHLLRVQRAWVGLRRCAINVYSVVRPWLRELNYRQAWASQRSRHHLFNGPECVSESGSSADIPPAQMSTDGFVHREPTHRNQEGVSHHEAIRIGLTPGSFAYNASRGLPG